MASMFCVMASEDGDEYKLIKMFSNRVDALDFKISCMVNGSTITYEVEGYDRPSVYFVMEVWEVVERI